MSDCPLPEGGYAGEALLYLPLTQTFSLNIPPLKKPALKRGGRKARTLSPSSMRHWAPESGAQWLLLLIRRDAASTLEAFRLRHSE